MLVGSCGLIPFCWLQPLLHFVHSHTKWWQRWTIVSGSPEKKLLQLIQSADVSQDPILLDTAFFPVNNKLLCFHQQPPSHCLSLFFTISHAGLAHHLSLGMLLQTLLPTYRWTWLHWSWEHTCAYLDLQLARCRPIKHVFSVLCIYYNLLFQGWIFQIFLSLEFWTSGNRNML